MGVEKRRELGDGSGEVQGVGNMGFPPEGSGSLTLLVFTGWCPESRDFIRLELPSVFSLHDLEQLMFMDTVSLVF